jgi:hypothetical protein
LAISRKARGNRCGDITHLSVGARLAFPLGGTLLGIAYGFSSYASTSRAGAGAKIVAANGTVWAPRARRSGGDIAHLSGCAIFAYSLGGPLFGRANAPAVSTGSRWSTNSTVWAPRARFIVVGITHLSVGARLAFPLGGPLVGIAFGISSCTTSAGAGASRVSANFTIRTPRARFIVVDIAHLSVGARLAFPLGGILLESAYGFSICTTSVGAGAILVSANFTIRTPRARFIVVEIANLSVGASLAFPLGGILLESAYGISSYASTSRAGAGAILVAANGTVWTPRARYIVGEIANLSVGAGYACTCQLLFWGTYRNSSHRREAADG